MKKIEIRHGFHPEQHREYHGENILKVKEIREYNGMRMICLEHDCWLKDLGGERYETDWTWKERWGRVVEVEYDDASGKQLGESELGYMILQVDRKNGLL